MKHLIILCAVFLVSCSSERADWDSGAAAQDAYQQERQEEQVETIRNQLPEVRPGTENAQPF